MALPSGIGSAVGLLAVLAAFVFYLVTLTPTVLYYDYPGMRDSAALQVKAYILGIPTCLATRRTQCSLTSSPTCPSGTPPTG